MKEDNTYVEDLMDADCEPDEQDGMITSITDMGMPKYSIADKDLNYGERTEVRVTIWHDNPNIDYLCQMRTTNGGKQNPWTDFVEVRREAHSNSPVTLSQVIEVPRSNVSSLQRVSVKVEVFCYGPATGEPYEGGLFGTNLWIAQAYFDDTVSYTYPVQPEGESVQQGQENIPEVSRLTGVGIFFVMVLVAGTIAFRHIHENG